MVFIRLDMKRLLLTNISSKDVKRSAKGIILILSVFSAAISGKMIAKIVSLIAKLSHMVMKKGSWKWFGDKFHISYLKNGNGGSYNFFHFSVLYSCNIMELFSHYPS